MIPVTGIAVEGFRAGESAVVIGTDTYLLPGTSWTAAIRLRSDEPSVENLALSDIRFTALSFMLAMGSMPSDYLERYVVPPLKDTDLAEYLDLDRFIETLKSEGWSVFDARRWQRESRDVYVY